MKDVAEGTPAKKRRLVKARKQKDKRKCQFFVSQNHIHQTQPWISGATHLHLQKQLF